MPPKKQIKDCLTILVNVGSTDETKDGEDTSFLEKSKQVMRHLIQRKIFMRPKDEVGVIMMGTSDTKNRLSYDNIVEMNIMQVPTWDLVENVTKLKGTKNSAIWVDGINVAIDYIKAECVDRSASRTLVLLTDFNEDRDVIEQYDVDTIVADIKDTDINLLAIGNKSLNADSKDKLNPSEKVFANFCKMVHGESMTFNDTIPKLMIYKDRAKNPTAWNVDMDIFDIELPVKVYLKTTEDFKLPRWQLSTDDNAQEVYVQRNYALVDKDKNVVSSDEIITGNMYGRKFIPFSDEDKAALKYEGGPKGFMIYGFTKRQNIKYDCLSGKGSYIVVPSPQFVSPFYSLVKAMDDSKKVAIVRRVYQMNTAPKMGVLIPRIDVPGEPWCLVYIELTFAEDRRILQLKPIKSTMNELSDNQEEAIDSLIDSMMLTEVEDETTNEKKEAFETGMVPDVCRQYMWDKLAYRALNPDEPLPPMSDFLRSFLEPPKSVQRKAEPVLQLVEKLFPMEVVEAKTHDKKFNPDESQQNVEPPLGEKTEEPQKDIPQNMETEEEELCSIADVAEAASPEIDIDLDKLANDM